MSGPPTDNERNRNSQTHDRLTDIADIGRARQQWLNDLGIYTFSDLAESSAEDLASQLQAAEHSIKLAMIQQWIEQARGLAHEQERERQGQQRDPFTDLEGINAARQQWLYSLEIYTFLDLAESSAEDIESQLRAAEHTITADEIQGWIDQSKAFVHEPVEQTDMAEPDSDNSEEDSPPMDDSDSENLVNGPEPPSSETSLTDISQGTEWHSLTSFLISYQTRQIADNAETRLHVQQTETDVQQTWPMTDITQLPAWILARIDEVSPSAPVLETAEMEQEIEQAIDIPPLAQIAQVRFLQSPRTEYVAYAGQQSKMIGPIQGNRPFMSEVSLSFNAEELANPDESLELQLQAFISNRITGDSFSITNSHSLLCKDVQPTVRVNLPETVLEMGIYRFQLIVSFANTVGTSDLFELPALQVI